jgi:hypothetical protein
MTIVTPTGSDPNTDPVISDLQKRAAAGDSIAAEMLRVCFDHQLHPTDQADHTAPGQLRYVIRTAADALKPHPPVPKLVDTLLSPGDLGVFYGEGGSGKTYSLISMAVNVAAGLPWLGLATTKTKVLIIDQESGEDRLGRRLGEVLRGENLGAETGVSYVCYANFKMDNKIDPTLLKALIEEVGAGLVVIDALAEIMDGDENSKQEIQPVFNELRRLADQTKAAVLVIHHSNKAGGYRGSTVVKNAVDLLVCVSKGETDNVINFETEKNRDGIASKWAAVATWIDDSFTLRSCEKQQKQIYSKSDRYVLNFLSENSTATMEQIKDSADLCTPNAARQAVFRLVEMGRVYRTNPGGQGVAATYALKQENEVF